MIWIQDIKPKTDIPNSELRCNRQKGTKVWGVYLLGSKLKKVQSEIQKVY